MNNTFIILTLLVTSLLFNCTRAQDLSLDTTKNLKIQKRDTPNQAEQSQNTQQVGAKLKPSSLAAVMPAADLAILMKNIEAINFRNPTTPACCGRLNMTNSTISAEAIRANGTSVMIVSNYSQGRVVVLASHLLFQEATLSANKNWVFLLRNAIRYAAKTNYTKYEVLAIGIPPSRSFKQLLNRSGLVSNITFTWDLVNFITLNKTQFQVVLIGQFSLQFLKTTDHQKIVQYVANGGGVVTTFRPQCRGCYNQPTSCAQLNRQCLHNSFLSQMGVKIEDGTIIQVAFLEYNITDKMNLTDIVPRKYQRRVVGNYSNLASGVLLNDYNIIIDGLTNITYGDAGFSSFRYFEESYISVVQQDKQSVMIAGRFGSGKLFFAGHGSIYQRTQAVNIKFFSNIVNWLTGNKTTFKVGFLFDNNTATYKNFGLISRNITRSGVWIPADLLDKEIICVTYYNNWPAALTTTMLTALRTYVQNGGKIFFFSHGWVWGSYGEGSRNSSLVYEINFASSVIASQFNVYLKDDYVGISDPKILFKNVRQTDIDDFLRNDFLKVLQGQAAFTANATKIAEYITRIQQAKNFSTTICDISVYHSIVNAFVLSRFNIEINYDRIAGNNVLHNNVYKIMNALSYSVHPLECRALPPSLNRYPGCASKIIPNRTVSVYKNRNKISYTGLYINPGEAIRVIHNNSNLDCGDITLVINHGDGLYGSNNGNLRRFPQVTKQFNIKSRDMNISSPHGGIIFFKIERLRNLTTPVTFQILGAYEAPYFNQNIHNISEFSVIRHIDAPLFVLEYKSFVHIGPTFGILGSIIISIEKLCNFWNKVILTYKNYRGISLTPFLKDSIYNDINIALGYMHSGHPIMTFNDAILPMLGWKNEIFLKGNWGIYHQLGHNHQDQKWTIDGTVEVTCNIYSVNLLWVMQGVPINSWLMEEITEYLPKMQNYMTLPFAQKLPVYSGNPRLGFYFFAILMQELGLEIFSDLHKKYDTLNVNPGTEGEKYQLLVEQLSLLVGMDLWNYFFRWGMPVTQTSKAKISHLPTYVCRRYPFING